MRILMAFILTPVSLALVAGLVMALAAAFGPSWILDFAGQALTVTLWSPLLAYPVAFLLGAPLFVVVRRFGRITVWSCLLGGAAASLVGSIAVIAVEGGDLVTAAAVGIFAAMIAIGAVYGVVFWLLAFARRTQPAGTRDGAAPAPPMVR